MLRIQLQSTKTYDVFYSPIKRRYKAVKQGFSWPAIFLSGTWLMAKRMYLLGLVIGFLSLLIIVVEELLKRDSSPLWVFLFVAKIIVTVGFAFYANEIWRWSLRKNGFAKVSTVDARWPSAAIDMVIEAGQTHEPGSRAAERA